MADYTPDEGELVDLQRMLAYEDMTLRLYVNKVTPANADTSSSYTAAAGGGYADKTLTAANWSASIVSNVATGTYAEQTFTFTGTLTSPSNQTGCATQASPNQDSLVVSDSSLLKVGQRVTHANIPAGTYITEITDSTHVKLSAPATTVGTGLTVSFANQIWGAVLIGATSGKVRRVMPRTEEPWYPEASGDYVKVTPTITHQTGAV